MNKTPDFFEKPLEVGDTVAYADVAFPEWGDPYEPKLAMATVIDVNVEPYKLLLDGVWVEQTKVRLRDMGDPRHTTVVDASIVIKKP